MSMGAFDGWFWGFSYKTTHAGQCRKCWHLLFREIGFDTLHKGETNATHSVLGIFLKTSVNGVFKYSPLWTVGGVASPWGTLSEPFSEDMWHPLLQKLWKCYTETYITADSCIRRIHIYEYLWYKADKARNSKTGNRSPREVELLAVRAEAHQELVLWRAQVSPVLHAKVLMGGERDREKDNMKGLFTTLGTCPLNGHCTGLKYTLPCLLALYTWWTDQSLFNSPWHQASYCT